MISRKLFQGFNEQLVLVRKVFLKPSVSQAGIPHNG